MRILYDIQSFLQGFVSSFNKTVPVVLVFDRLFTLRTATIFPLMLYRHLPGSKNSWYRGHCRAEYVAI